MGWWPPRRLWGPPRGGGVCPAPRPPPVLPAPDPMPRPMRKRFFREPCFGAISFNFIAVSLFPVHHANEMLHLVDHPARHRIVRQIAPAADLVQPEPNQGLALSVLPPQRAAYLFDLDHLA